MKLLKLPEVSKKTSLSKAAIYAKMERGEFPRPVRTGPMSVAWKDEEIEKWIESLPLAGPARSK